MLDYLDNLEIINHKYCLNTLMSIIIFHFIINNLKISFDMLLLSLWKGIHNAIQRDFKPFPKWESIDVFCTRRFQLYQKILWYFENEWLLWQYRFVFWSIWSIPVLLRLFRYHLNSLQIYLPELADSPCIRVSSARCIRINRNVFNGKCVCFFISNILRWRSKIWTYILKKSKVK